MLALAACGAPVTVEWTRPAGAPSYSTPAVAGEALVFGNEAGDVIALNARDGRTLWTFRAQRAVVAGPVVWGGKVLVGSTNYLFYALDLASGAEVWKFPARDRIKGDAAVDESHVYFGSYDGHVYALNADRSVAWVFPEAGSEALVPRDFSYSSPRISQGTLYLGNHDGHLYALSTADGSMRWRFKTEMAITSTPFVDKRRIYFGSNDGKIRAVEDAGSEARLLWAVSTGAAVNAAPRVHEGTLYVGSTDARFYAVDAKSGAVRWTFETEAPLVAGTAVSQGLIFTGGGAHDGRILAFDPGGKLVWSMKTGFKIDSDPVALGDRVYVTGGDGRVYALRVKAR